MKTRVLLGLLILIICSIGAIGVLMAQEGSMADQTQHTTDEVDMYPNLTDKQEKILFEKDTERPFTSELLEEKRTGTYVTADTGLPVFRSEAKYDSGTGWPSFYEAIDENVELKEDNSLFMKRVEVVSKDTGAHLGHVFDDGPEPTGKRFCMNGLALKFVPDETASDSATKE